MRQFIYTIGICILALTAACKKDDRLTYEQDARIYFVKQNSASDSIYYTFGIRPAEFVTDTVYFTMRTMGSATNTDREINLLVNEKSTAKPGYHFSFGPLIMPAGQYETKIPVYMYRKPGLKDSIVIADFYVGESKDFKPGYDDTAAVGAVLSRLHVRLRLDDQILKPTNWDGSLKPYFGDFSIVKYRFMIEVTGKTNWLTIIYPSERAYLVQQMHLALYNYELANGPMIDENGNTIVFP